jgi:hypothetical protein
MGNNICAARNIARYHYRIKANGSGEIFEECLTPYCVFTCGSIAAAVNCWICCCCPVVALAQSAYVVAFVAPVQKEVAVQKPNLTNRYLVGFEPQQFQVVAQLPVGVIATNAAYPQQDKQQTYPPQPPQQPYPLQQQGLNNTCSVEKNPLQYGNNINNANYLTPVVEARYVLESPVDEK